MGRSVARLGRLPPNWASSIFQFNLPVALLSSVACELAPLRIVLLCVFLYLFFFIFFTSPLIRVSSAMIMYAHLIIIVFLFFLHILFAHPIVFLHIVLSFCTSYCFFLHILLFCTFFISLHILLLFLLFLPHVCPCVMLLYITCILIILHCPLSGPGSITFHF